MSASESTSAVTDWDYHSFNYIFPVRYMRLRLGGSYYTETKAKRKFWKKSKDKIWIELQKWLDRGWEPVGKVDASCVEISTDEARDENLLAILLVILVGWWFEGRFHIQNQWLFALTYAD